MKKRSLCSKEWKLYVGCLPVTATEESVIDLLSSFGQVVGVSLNLKKGKCIGHGCVEVMNSRNYETLISSTIFYGDRKLELSPYLSSNTLKKMQRDVNIRKVVVRSLFSETTTQELYDALVAFYNQTPPDEDVPEAGESLMSRRWG